MEPKPTYITASPAPTPAACPTCAEPFGEVVQVDGRAWLRVGGLDLWAAHGVCRHCEHEYHWTAGVIMERMIERHKAKIE